MANLYKKNENPRKTLPLYDGQHSDKSGDWHDGHHAALNKVLDAINEYGS